LWRGLAAYLYAISTCPAFLSYGGQCYFRHKINQSNASLCGFAKQAFNNLVANMPALQAQYNQARIALGN